MKIPFFSVNVYVIMETGLRKFVSKLFFVFVERKFGIPPDIFLTSIIIWVRFIAILNLHLDETTINVGYAVLHILQGNSSNFCILILELKNEYSLERGSSWFQIYKDLQRMSSLSNLN